MNRKDQMCAASGRAGVKAMWPGACVSINFGMFRHEKRLCIGGTSFHAACFLSSCMSSFHSFIYLFAHLFAQKAHSTFETGLRAHT